MNTDNWKHECLSVLMSNLSEDMYCAGWHIGLEYVLWRKLVNNDIKEDEQLAFKWLNEISKEINGWIIWDDDEKDEQIFIPMDKWLKMYEEWDNELYLVEAIWESKKDA